MLADVIPSINEIRSDELQGKTVMVIDVLRATSTITTALANGSSGVIPVETVCRAKQYQSADQEILLGGERFCKKINGFDLGNSPLEYGTDIVKDKRIVLTTTNGTRAIQKSIKGSQVIAACFLNIDACIQFALESKKDVAIVCSGTQDRFSLEDGLCAGLLIQRLSEADPKLVCNDFATAMRAAYLQMAEHLEEVLMSSDNGRRMCKIGFEADIRFCARLNEYSVVPILNGQMLTPYRF
ncbi:2-phosphosulfolactate phosphatase [Marinicrinis lubricantis]|uniref:Probable 2-phosphosulfolactate phosphatase n=1 Tax=Marinicrinis lubricantis TaxID=2086470 RepID=A0ABW1IRM6_9BACL